MTSAAVIGPALESTVNEGVGAMVLSGVRATRQVVSTNTNLGMLLLIAPLAAASARGKLREHLPRVLSNLSQQDTAAVFMS